MKKTIGVIVLNSLMVLGISAKAAVYKSIPEKGKTTFKAKALGLKFEGKGAGISGQVKIENEITSDNKTDKMAKIIGEFEFQLDTLDTGIDLRNEHMKENYLETKMYPKGKFVVTELIGFNPMLKNQEIKIAGMLTIKDQTKKIKETKVQIEKIDHGYHIKTNFNVNISDFNIKLPKYAGVVLKDQIELEISSHLENQEMKKE